MPDFRIGTDPDSRKGYIIRNEPPYVVPLRPEVFDQKVEGDLNENFAPMSNGDTTNNDSYLNALLALLNGDQNQFHPLMQQPDIEQEG